MEQSELHLLANHSCCLSSEQLSTGLVQFGKSTLVSGFYTAEAYSTSVLYAVSRTFDILVLIVRRTKPSVRLAFPVIRSACGFQKRESDIHPKIPRTCDRLQDLSMQYVISFTDFLDPVTCTTWYFEGLNPISHLVSHADKMLRSFLEY